MFAVFHQFVMNLVLMCVKSGPLIEQQVARFTGPYLVRGGSVQRLATLAVRAHQMPLQHLFLLRRKSQCLSHRLVMLSHQRSVDHVSRDGKRMLS